MTVRLATIADREHIRERAAYNRQLWGDGRLDELLSGKNYITVLDGDDGGFYMQLDADGVTVHFGLHFGFERGDAARYQALWQFCFQQIEKQWPKALYGDTVMGDVCFAPAISDVAKSVAGLTLTDAASKRYGILLSDLKKKLGLGVVPK
jgi:hypothetical protein